MIEKEQKDFSYWWAWIFSLIILSIFIFRVASASASTVFYDNFESYTVNTLLSGTGWQNLRSNAYVRNTQANSPTKSVSIEGYGGIKKTFATQEPKGVISWYWRSGTTTVTDYLLRAYANCGSVECLRVELMGRGTAGVTIRHYFSRSTYVDYPFYNQNEWIKISLAYNVLTEQNVLAINDVYIDNPYPLMRNAPNGNLTNITFATETQAPFIPSFIDDLKIDNESLWFRSSINTNIDNDLEDTRSDFNTVLNQNCLIGDPCKLWFSFNEKAIGKTIYLTLNKDGQRYPDSFLATTTITYDQTWQNFVLVPQQTEATTTNYCLYLLDNEYGDFLYCGIKIAWVTTEMFNDYFDSLMSELADPCADIASSTGTFFDDLRYNLECSARKTIYWSFVPSKGATNQLNKSTTAITGSFPFNTYFGLINKVNNSLDQATLNNSGSIGIPFIKDLGGGNSEFFILPVLASSSMENAIGQDNTDTFRTTIGWAMWLLVALIIIITVRFKRN